jgi:hypothetical protein
MERVGPMAVTSERVRVGPLLRVGALAALLSASANAIVLAMVSSLFGPIVTVPDQAVTISQVMGASAAGAVGAAFVFAVIGRFARRPTLVFWGVAAVGLLLSFVPIAVAGAAGSSAGALALMHTVAAAINVGLLTRLGRNERGMLGRPGIRRGGW